MKRVGPGVDTTVPMHHAGDGLFVQRVADGKDKGVRVMCTNGEDPAATGGNLRFDATLSDSQWRSLDKAARELPTEPVPERLPKGTEDDTNPL